jgi:hypothetical protein
MLRSAAPSFLSSLSVESQLSAESQATIIHGGWSEWGAWGVCTGACGTEQGTQTRTREVSVTLARF